MFQQPQCIHAVLFLAVTEVVMKNYKFIGEWLKERGLQLKPNFSRILRDMCWEFKKTTA